MEIFNEHVWDKTLFSVNIDFTKREHVLSVLDRVAKKVNLQVMEEWYIVSRGDLLSVQVCICENW